ncbi:MAG: M23 family metallopeptidase [Candidatus Saccharicenans sp.]|uniref:M23 family metallopeptidase n=1 Tax=Candidatus Saccharicenans sp. TaxID=2819258 RepID=UPI00404A3397
MTARRRINRKKALALALILLAVSILTVILLLNRKAEKTELRLQSQEAARAPEPPPIEAEEFIIPAGQTITELLAPYGFTPSRVIEIREATRQVYDLARIPAGQKIRLFRRSGEYLSLQLDLDPERYLEVDLSLSPPSASIKSRPVTKQLVLVEGIIKDSLIAAINEAGEQDLLALMMAEIFGWVIDFYVDLRPDDSFRLLVEKKYIDGQFSGYGPILAARFTNKNQTFEAYRYVFPDSGRADYFEPSGGSLRKEFLKSPLRYARITSRFSHSRLHPIRKIYRPHYGIDYAAPVGTPVQATADGQVTFAGWNGAAGRMVKIRHKNAYETMYLHLRSPAPGIKVGARVEGGQVIGYVGSSGESTGPHLDYRLLYHGCYVNPLSWKFQPADPLPTRYLPDFQQKVKVYQHLLLFPLPYF